MWEFLLKIAKFEFKNNTSSDEDEQSLSSVSTNLQYGIKEN